MSYLLIYPNGEIRQTSYITRLDSEEARIFSHTKAGYVEATEFHECMGEDGYLLPWVGVEWWNEPRWILCIPPDPKAVVASCTAYKRKAPKIAHVWPKGRMELWLGKHNHEMELLRTFTSAAAAVVGVLVFLKVFGVFF